MSGRKRPAAHAISPIISLLFYSFILYIFPFSPFRTEPESMFRSANCMIQLMLVILTIWSVNLQDMLFRVEVPSRGPRSRTSSFANQRCNPPVWMNFWKSKKMIWMDLIMWMAKGRLFLVITGIDKWKYIHTLIRLQKY